MILLNFKYKIQQVLLAIGGEKEIIIDHGTYSKTHTTDLLKQLNEKGNSKLSC